MNAPRVVEALNSALHQLFAERDDLHLLGEDVLDPYGGAFKVTRGLSTQYPSRVLTTPLSEAGIAGVAGGLALGGDQVIVEAMFGDFAALMFDPVLNLVSKSATMFGHSVPMRVVVRAPVGGHRGYGPTHSQSVQKHFVGIPNLSLYETSPFHDPYRLLSHALDNGPSMLFEDKVLYTRRLYRDEFTLVGSEPGWAHVRSGGTAQAVLICPGGVAHAGLAAQQRLREAGISMDLLVPGRLYPLDLDPILPLVSGVVVVAEESTAGGTWGSDVAAMLYERLWGSLRAPIVRLSSADSIIPSARHLEDQVLLGEQDIVEAVNVALGSVTPVAQSIPVSQPVPAAATSVSVPKLNNNDETYLVLAWLVSDGDVVEPGAPLVELETSKAVEVIESTVTGTVRLRVDAGIEAPVGTVLAEISGDSAPVHRNEPVVQSLSKVQQATAAVVTRAHREVPAAFTAVEIRLSALLERLADTEVGLPEAVVKAVALAQPDFPHLFGVLRDSTTVELATSADIAVTLDTGNGLFTPVLRDCATRPITDLADDLMAMRMKAWQADFTAAELTGGAITVSLNIEDGVLFVQPIVMWPQLCMLSVGGPRSSVVMEDGPVEVTVVTLGLAYDHRVVNGREAVGFLRTVGETLTARIDKLLS